MWRLALIIPMLSGCEAVPLRATNFLMDYDETNEIERFSTINAIDHINTHLGCNKLTLLYDTRENRGWSNTITFVDHIDIKNALGVTTILWSDINGWEADVEVLTSKNTIDWRSFEEISSWYGLTLVHEIGHALGLEHVIDDEDNIMYPKQRQYGSGLALYPDVVWIKFINDLAKQGVVCP